MTQKVRNIVILTLKTPQCSVYDPKKSGMRRNQHTYLSALTHIKCADLSPPRVTDTNIICLSTGTWVFTHDRAPRFQLSTAATHSSMFVTSHVAIRVTFLLYNVALSRFLQQVALHVFSSTNLTVSSCAMSP